MPVQVKKVRFAPVMGENTPPNGSHFIENLPEDANTDITDTCSDRNFSDALDEEGSGEEDDKQEVTSDDLMTQLGHNYVTSGYLAPAKKKPFLKDVEDANLDQLCTLCQEPAAKVCGQCEATFYCSQNCLYIDWPCHSLLCEASTRMGSPPSGEHALGFYFPVDKETPEFIWYTYDQKQVECRVSKGQYEPDDWLTTEHPITYTKKGTGYPIVHTKEDIFEFKSEAQMMSVELIDCNKRLKRPLQEQRTLQFYRLHDLHPTLYGEQGKNQCIKNLTSHFGRAEKIPRGPCVLIPGPAGHIDGGTDEEEDFEITDGYGFRTDWERNASPQHVELGDLRHIADWFLYHRTSYKDGTAYEGIAWAGIIGRSPLDKYDFVRGEKERTWQRAWSHYKMPRMASDQIYTKGAISPLSAILGIPLRMKIHKATKRRPSQNVAIKKLMTTLNADESLSWGRTPGPWSGEVGSVWIARQDRGILGTYIKDLLRWYDRDLSHRILEAQEIGTKNARMQVLAYITMKNFNEFLEQGTARQGARW
ncbi:hypothetical protein F5Y15DRAFT_428508 [Xylariaceae sp. FL0016]|nr:hypothetical protein F5Y15DRAFT_428508 [Xylariaceae sp. FL0016]